MKAIRILLILISSSAFAQVGDAIDLVNGLVGNATPQTVHDPTSQAQMATLLTQTGESVSAAKEQIEYLKKAKDLMQQVNDNLRQITYMQEIILIEEKIFEMSQQTLDDANNMDVLYHKQVLGTINGFNTLMIGMESTMTIFYQLMTDDYFEMETADRLKLLREYRQEALDHMATARELRRLVIEVGTLSMLNRTYNRTERRNDQIFYRNK